MRVVRLLLHAPTLLRLPVAAPRRQRPLRRLLFSRASRASPCLLPRLVPRGWGIAIAAPCT
jgi:hypothetical protein